MKYNSKKALCIRGHKHDSKKEAARCNELHLMQTAGVIKDLQIQVPMEIIPSQKFETMENERPCRYIADFTYRRDDGVFVIEDTKGFKTPEYIIKRKLIKRLICIDGEVIFIET